MISSLTDFYRPRNKEELFNLRHASAWNIIEHIFGVIKCKYRILLIPPEYNMEIQACITASLAVVHNSICSHQLEEEEEIDEDDGAPIGMLMMMMMLQSQLTLDSMNQMLRGMVLQQ